MFKEELKARLDRYNNYLEARELTSEEIVLVKEYIQQVKSLIDKCGSLLTMEELERYSDNFSTMSDLIDFTGLKDKYKSIDTAIPMYYWRLKNSRYMVMVYPDKPGFIGGLLKGLTMEAQQELDLLYPEWSIQ